MSNPVVPKMASDTIPIAGLDELTAHLDDLVASPETPLQPKLLDDVELQLTEANIPPLLPSLLPKLTTILKTTPHDPSPVVSLAVKLLSPVSFTDTLKLADETSLITALRSPAPSANLLALAILEKAAAAPSDAAILALMPRVVAELLRRWLAAPQVEVGERAGRVIGDLLETDCELPPPTALPSISGGGSFEVFPPRRPRAPGQGRMWRRLFHDRETFGLVLSLAKGVDPEDDAQNLSEHQLSLAQGRILRVLPRLASLNALEVGTSQFPELTGSADVGLLQLAALRMVDTRDALMHLSLIDFFETLVSVMRLADRNHRTIGILRNLVREAGRDDEMLREALRTLPDRTVPEESEELRTFIRDVMTGRD